MKLRTLHLKRFRSFDNQAIHISPYTALIGPNGSGKSTILAALNVLFRNTVHAPTDVATLTKEDFFRGRTEKPIEITAHFVELCDRAKEDFDHYVRQDKLIITAVAEWDEGTQSAQVFQYGSRMQVPDFERYFAADRAGARATELKAIYRELREKHKELPAEKVKARMEGALLEYSANHPERCEAVRAEEQFYGWSRGANRLEKYVQWVYVPAVKHASSEDEETRGTALGDLLQRTIRKQVDFSEDLEEIRGEILNKYDDLLDESSETLNEVSELLEARLQRWSSPRARLLLNWHRDRDKSVRITEPFAKAMVGDDIFAGELARMGHGLQRSFIIALLEQLARTTGGGDANLILGVEEPELYQHPPQARQFADVLKVLSENDAQVVLTTHSPLFVRPRDFDDIRLFRKDRLEGAASVAEGSSERVAELIADALGEEPKLPTVEFAKIEQILTPAMAELFFCSLPILVEGEEDTALLSTAIILAERWQDFRACGLHFVACDGKTNMSRPLAMAECLGLPVFAVFDGDTGAKAEKLPNHERDNACLLALSGERELPPLPAEDLFGERVVVWTDNIQRSITGFVGRDRWFESMNHVRHELGLEGVGRKNKVLLAATLKHLHDEDVPIEPLQRAVRAIFAFAERQGA